MVERRLRRGLFEEVVEYDSQRVALKVKLVELQAPVASEVLVSTKRKKLFGALFADVDVQPVNTGSGLDHVDPEEIPIVEEQRNVFIPQNNGENSKNLAVHEVNNDSDCN